jgi:hypothetical protein
MRLTYFSGEGREVLTTCAPLKSKLSETLAVILLCLLSAKTARADVTEPLRGFISEHCYDCHQGTNAEAGLDLEALATNLEFDSDARHDSRFDSWVKVFDRVAASEMPPPDAEPSPIPGRDEFLAETKSWLREIQTRQQQRNGRVHGRRLTNLQLERTLQDLLGIDIPLEREMPEEPKTGQYKTLAALQSISHFHLEEHLKIVDLALDEAFRRALTPSDEWLERMTAQQISRTRTRTREPEYIDEAAVVWSGNLIFYGRLPATTAKESGWYRFRFEVASLKQPQSHGVWCSINSGLCVSSAPLMSWIGAFEATEQPQEVVVDAWLPAGHMLEIRPADSTLKKAKFAGGQSDIGEGGRQDVPGVRIQWLEMERIHVGPADEAIQELLFGDLPVATAKNVGDSRVEFEHPSTEGHRLVAEFASRAFRRPASAEQLLGFCEIFDDAFTASANVEKQDVSQNPSVAFLDALRASYRAILCSPRFLYFHELPGQLDDYAIASRMSYMLWNSMPDERLIELASQGELNNPAVLRAELRRMMNTVRGKQFHKDFAYQWLELSEIDFTEPDARLHPEFDRVVQYSMLDETHHFLQTMLDENRSLQELLNANFTYANSRLARYYDLPPIEGDSMRLIELNPDDHRGGLLAQGAILKVTANGTNTSPVLRGVWVSRRILGQPIAPPPENVPAIEPDIRGAKTIREQLEKHRDQADCAACHTKIDPPGYALETFDAAGKWREHYPQVDEKRIKLGPKIDSSFVTSDGRPFSNFEGFRQLQAARVEPLARNFAEQLLTYGTGATITFADRDELNHIVATVRDDNYGMYSVLEAVITSPIFLTK